MINKSNHVLSVITYTYYYSICSKFYSQGRKYNITKDRNYNKIKDLTRRVWDLNPQVIFQTDGLASRSTTDCRNPPHSSNNTLTEPVLYQLSYGLFFYVNYDSVFVEC